MQALAQALMVEQGGDGHEDQQEGEPGPGGRGDDGGPPAGEEAPPGVPDPVPPPQRTGQQTPGNITPPVVTGGPAASRFSVPLSAVGFLPDAATINGVVAAGSYFSLILAHTGIDAIFGRKFLAKAGISEDDLYNIVAPIRDDEIETALDGIAADDGAPVPLGLKAKVRTAFLIARSLAGVTPAPPPVAASSSATSQGMTDGNITNDPNTVALADTVDQTSKAVIRILPPDKIKKTRAKHIAKVGTKPTEDEDVAKEQLSALFVAVTIMICRCTPTSRCGSRSGSGC